MQNLQGIIKKPIITEKATMISETMNRFTFEVIQTANKIEIKNAVEKCMVFRLLKFELQTSVAVRPL